MLKYLLFILSAGFLNCTNFQSNESAATQHPAGIDSAATDYTKHSVDYRLADSFKVAKLREYAPEWNKNCFPLPVGKLLLRDYKGERGYDYIAENFDSLTAKISTEKERSAGAPCTWKQTFKSGVIYTISSCQASGATIEIRTQCADKMALVHLVDILFYQSLNSWNADSSAYTPILEGPGCYYNIDRNDQGTYDLKYTCDN